MPGVVLFVGMVGLTSEQPVDPIGSRRTPRVGLMLLYDLKPPHELSDAIFGRADLIPSNETIGKVGVPVGYIAEGRKGNGLFRWQKTKLGKLLRKHLGVARILRADAIVASPIATEPEADHGATRIVPISDANSLARKPHKAILVDSPHGAEAHGPGAFADARGIQAVANRKDVGNARQLGRCFATP